MANIGEPLRRITVVPITAPIQAPEGPRRSLPPSVPQVPARPLPEKEPV